MIRGNAAVIAASAAVCALATLPLGCASPSSHLYTLSPSVVVTVDADANTSNLFVVVGPVSIPAIVDRPQIVVSQGANQVSLEEFNRWASPLQSNISHVVADDLAAMLGTSRVALFQQSQDAEVDYRVAIEVQSFESVLGGSASLNALWSVRRVKGGKTQTGRTKIREPTHQPGYDALVAAHSRALARLSQDIADAIRALDRTHE